MAPRRKKGEGDKFEGYRQRKRQDRRKYYCRLCFDNLRTLPDMKVKEYIAHLLKVHDRKEGVYCPWCFLEFRTPGIILNAKHLYSCYEMHRDTFELPVLRVDPLIERPDESIVVCGRPNYPDCKFDCDVFRSGPFCREDVFKVDVDGFYEKCYLEDRLEGVLTNVSLYNDEKEPLSREDRLILSNTFAFSERSGLGDVECLKKYVSTRNRAGVAWCHLMVKACAYGSFLEEMKDVDVGLLRYWCVCNGTQHPDYPPDHVHHRHMIAVTSDFSSFKRAWDKINVPDRVKRNENVKNEIRVGSEFHFVNLLAYVSHERSSCKGFHDKDPCFESDDSTSHRGHYFLNVRTFHHSRLALHLLLPNGMQKFLECSAGRRYVWKILQWLERGRKNSSWKIPVRRVFDLINCELPLEEGWLPDETATIPLESLQDSRPYLFVSNRHAVLMKSSNDREEATYLNDINPNWTSNYLFDKFWEKVGEGDFVLTKKQQYAANEMDLLRKEKDKQASTSMHEQQRKYVALIDETRNDFDRYKVSAEKYKVTSAKKLANLEASVEKWMRMYEQRDADATRLGNDATRYADEVTRLGNEVTRLNNEVVPKLHDEVARLNDVVIKGLEKQIKGLEKQISGLENENKDLKRRLEDSERSFKKMCIRFGLGGV